MTQKKNYWTYCKDCDTYHTCEDINKKWHDPDIPQLPALPEDEKGPPLWTPDMKGTSMEWVLAMQLEHQKRKEVDGRIDWGMMNHISYPGDWV
jgi:hypothetical protein